MGRLNGFIHIIRPINSIMLAFSIIVSIFITSKSTFIISILEISLAFITGFSLSSSAMAINDYYDREVDAINEPNRPIPSGLVKPHEALLLSLILSIIGLTSAWFTKLSCFLVATFAWLLMMGYSTFGKKTGFFGNLMVSTCIALPFVYGGIITSNISSSILFSTLAFLSNTGREITKGIVDVSGDYDKNIKTIAVSFGSTNASRIAIVFYLASVFISIIPILYDLVSFWYWPFVFITDIGLIFCCFILFRAPNRENSKRVKTIVLYLMLCGLIAFAAGRIW